MSTKGVIRAWYNTGSQYIFWGVTQITDPLSEYPSGGGYPAAATLSDFVLLDYDGVADFNGSLLNITWAIDVYDGYAVYIDSVTDKAELGQADDYDTSRIVGIAYIIDDKVVCSGEYEAYCEGTCDNGAPLFLSEITPGVVTNTAPMTTGDCLIRVGTASEEKTNSNIDLIKIAVDPNEPIELEITLVAQWIVSTTDTTQEWTVV